MVFVLNNNAPASPGEIADFERRAKISLPPDYRQFLLETNGGRRAAGGAFKEATSGEKIGTIKIMLGLTGDPDYSIDTHLSYLDERIPTELIPIAYDRGGNYLLLDCSDARRGCVYFLGLESADPESPPSRDSLTLVSRSFKDFRGQLD
jgi:hypothetical protein